MIDAVSQFRDAICSTGLAPPNIIEPGMLHRFPGVGKRNGNTAGWCKLFPDGLGGCFGDWSSGFSENWQVKRDKPYSLLEQDAFKQRVDETRAQSEAERQQKSAAAAEQAAAIWENATPAADDHPYLIQKSIQANGTRLHKGALVVPVRENGTLHSLLLIDEDGDKRFLKDGRVAGCYFSIGSTKGAQALCIAEGFSTAATIHDSTGYPVAVAFSAGNLESVAKTMRERFTELPLIICADDDAETDGNPGLTKASQAADVTGASVALPVFGEQRPAKATDFNDMAALSGLGSVAAAIKKAVPPDDWPEPKTIHAELHPVPAFDPETLLPEVLRNWVMDEADRMPCPPDFVAAGALVALGAIIGATCAIKPKSRDDWLVVPNLWGGTVGPPSAKKSPAIGAALKPLERLVAQAMEGHQAKMKEFEYEKLIFDAKKKAIESSIKAAAKDAKDGDPQDLVENLRNHEEQAPESPVLKRYKSNDTTIEKLGELLRDTPTGLLIMRDELAGLIAAWEKQGHEGDRTFFLEAWNGIGSFDTDRIGRGTIFIPNLCISIFGGIQPDKLIALLEQTSKALANDGMLQRFQVLVYPDHREWEWRDCSPDKDARDRAFSVFESLADLDPEIWGAIPADEYTKFPHFRFDDRAQAIFIEWSTDLHVVRLPKEENLIIAQHLEKFDRLFPAIALILHLVDCAVTERYGPVTEDAALRAAAWCDYLEAHARRCYGLLMDEGLRAAQALADKIRLGKLHDGFTARDVTRNQWSCLTSSEAVQAALNWLADEDWLRSKEVGGAGPGTGRRTQRHFINPEVMKVAKKGDDRG